MLFSQNNPVCRNNKKSATLRATKMKEPSTMPGVEGSLIQANPVQYFFAGHLTDSRAEGD